MTRNTGPLVKRSLPVSLRAQRLSDRGPSECPTSRGANWVPTCRAFEAPTLRQSESRQRSRTYETTGGSWLEILSVDVFAAAACTPQSDYARRRRLAQMESVSSV